MEPAVPKWIFFSANHMGLGEGLQEWQYEDLCGASPQ